jgi:uncharacterized membrane protein
MKGCCSRSAVNSSSRPPCEGRSGRGKHLPLRTGIGLLIAFAVISIIVGATTNGGLLRLVAGSEAHAGVTPVTSANEVAFPEGAFSDGKARFFEHKTPEGKRIKYFVLKSSDGVIRAAFDACDVCWESGKGYKQDGDFMVCQNCGRRFQSAKVNVVTGGCNPSALTRTFRDGKVVISTQALLEGRRLFN